jgi:hypothetical protein
MRRVRYVRRDRAGNAAGHVLVPQSAQFREVSVGHEMLVPDGERDSGDGDGACARLGGRCWITPKRVTRDGCCFWERAGATSADVALVRLGVCGSRGSST